MFCGIVFQQLLASGILFGHISSSPFIFRGHFDLSPELYGLTFGLLALGITAGAVISSRIDPLKALGVGAVGIVAGGVGGAGALTPPMGVGRDVRLRRPSLR